MMKAGKSPQDVISMAEAMMRDLKKYADMDVDELLSKLNEDELQQLANMVDPDDSLVPPSERCANQTSKTPTGPLNRKKLLAFLEKFAKEQEDWPEVKPHIPGQKRGKVYIPKTSPKPTRMEPDIEVELDIGGDYDKALNVANESELVDLAAILGLHSLLSQEQFHASVTNKPDQLTGSTFDSVVKASRPKIVPREPDNKTNPTETAKQVAANDPKLKSLNWNNIKHIRKEDFYTLFDGLKKNTNLESLSICNTRLTDATLAKLVEALRENKHLRSLSIESNYISGPMLRSLLEATLVTQTLREFRACNQRPSILGNKVEMDIASLVEQSSSLRVVGLSFDVPDARVRITRHLQNNIDGIRKTRRGQMD